MPEPKYSTQEFAQIIKQKYPQYADVEDSALVSKILEKYPQYSSSVDLGLKKKDEQQLDTSTVTEESMVSESRLDGKKEPTLSYVGSRQVAVSPDLVPTEEAFVGARPSQKPMTAEERRATLEAARESQANNFINIARNTLGAVAEGAVGLNTYLNRGIELLLLGNQTNYFSSGSAAIGESLQRDKEKLQAEYIGEETIGKPITQTLVEDPVKGAKLIAFEASRLVPQMYALGAAGRSVFPSTTAAGKALETGTLLSPRTKLAAEISSQAGPMIPLGMSAAGSSYAELAKDNPEDDIIDAITNIAVASYKGAGEIASELLFRTSVDDLIRGGFRKNLISDIAKADKPVLQALKGTAKKTGTEAFQEGIEELAVEISNNAIDGLVFGEDMLSANNIYGMADAFILGAGIGGPITLLSQGPSSVGIANDVNKRRKISEEINDLYDRHQNGNLTAVEKTIIRGQIANKLAELKQVENSLADFYSEFSEEDQQKVLEENRKISMGQLMYKESSDDIVKEAIADVVAKSYSEKTKIESKYDPNIKVYEYDSKEETGLPSPIQEGEATVAAEPVVGEGQKAPEADRVLQAQEALILEALGSDETLAAVEAGQEIDQADVEAVQQKILNLIDSVSKSEMAEESKAIYIQTLEDKFDELEYYDNKTITTAEQVTERVPVGPAKPVIKEQIGAEVRRGKLKIYERLENVEVATGKETDTQTSVVEVQDDGSVDIVTYDKKTKQEVSRDKRVADSILGLEYVESITDSDGNVTGVVMRPATAKGEAESELRIEIKNRPDLSLDLAIEARKRQIGYVPNVEFEQAYEEVTKTVERKEKAPVKERPVAKQKAVEKPVAEEKPEPKKPTMKVNTVMTATKKAERLIGRIAPNSGITVVTHATTEAFNEAMDSLSSSKSKKGVVEGGRYLPARKQIHINLEVADTTVPFHEAFHALFIEKFSKGNQKLREKMANEFYTAISNILRNGTEQDKALADAVDIFVRDGGYSSAESPEEFSAQVAGYIANNGQKISKGVMDKLLQWLNDFVSKVFPSLKVNTRGEFIDFMNSFSGAMLELNNQDVIPAINLESTEDLLESSSRGAFTISYFEDTDQYKKFVEDGLVVNNFNLEDIAGQPVATHQPDNFMVGDVKIGDKLIVEGDGGVYFVLKFGEVWASGKPSSASGIAQAINWSRKNSTDGKGRMLLVRGTTPKLISSTKGVKGGMQILEEMVEKNLIPRKDFRASLIRVGKQYGIDFSGNDSMSAIKKDIEDKFMKPSDSTFAKRGSFFEDLIVDLSNTSQASTQNIAEIRKFLGATKRISFSKEGITSAIAELMTERMLLDLPNTHAYAIIEVDNDVKVVKSKKHDSYPYSIVQVDNKRPTLYLIKDRIKAVPALLTKDGERATNAKVGFAQMGYGRAIVDPAISPTTIQAQETYDNILKESSSRSMDDLFKAQRAGLLMHATRGDFDTFNPERIYGGERAVYGYGFYFTGWAPKAMDYGNKFVFTPLEKYDLLDVESKIDLNFVNYIEKEARKNISKIEKEYSDYSDRVIDRITKPSYDALTIALKMDLILDDGESISVDEIRKRLDNNGILNYREFSDAFKSIGYDGFHAGSSQTDYYQVVIFNFDKLNSNLISDEAQYIAKKEADKLYSDELKESSSRKYTSGQQQSQIDAEVDDTVGKTTEWKEKERTSFERFVDLIRLKIQDKNRDIIRMQENVELATEKPVGLDQDFRNAETLMYGKAANDLQKTEEKVRVIASLIKDSGLNIEEFNDLLYALHAQERNRYIRIASTDIGEAVANLRKELDMSPKEVAELLDIPVEDYKKIEDGTIEKGVTAEELSNILNLYGVSQYDFFYENALVKDGSGMTDQEAQEILSKYGIKNLVDPSVSELPEKVSKAVKAVHDLIANTRETMLDFGLESLDTIYVFETTYKNYVPLQGFADENSEIYAPEILEGGRKLEVRGRLKQAKGRGSKADSPLTQAIMQNTNTIIRARKNEVMQSLYNLAKNNPNKDVWQTIDPQSDQQYKLDKKNGKISKVAKTISDYMSDPSIVAVRIDGDYKFIQFVDPRMAETLRGATVVNSDFIVKFLGGFNRLLSSFITTYDPEFVLRNFSRDIQTAVFNAYSEQQLDDGIIKGEEIVGKIIKSVPKSVKTIYALEKGKESGGDAEFDQYYKEFLEDGAKTAWFYSKGTEELSKDIQGYLDGKKDSPLKLASNLVERVNTSVENGVRFAAYVQSRKAGIERAKAAEFAKNLTVNFNKSGEWGTVANSLYLFFNASVQGTSRLIRTLKPKFKKNDDGTRSLQVTTAQKLAIGMAIAGALMSMLNEALSDDDEDGKSFYSKIPDFEKERNIIIMKPNGKGYFKIPLPYGINVFYVFGGSMADAGQGIQKPAEAITNVLQAAVGSFSPINFPNSDDASKWITKLLMPTIGQIPLSLALNEDYFGRSIYNTNFPFDKTPKPQSELTRGDKGWAKWLNKATGGSEFRSGFIDINPDKTDFILETLSGGAGRFVMRSTKVITSVASGNWDELEPREIPFARVFYGQPSKYTNLNDYYKKNILVNQMAEEAKAGIISGKERANVLKMQAVNKSVASNLRKYKKLEDSAMNIKDAEKKDARMLQLEKMRYAEIARFQKLYEKLNIDDIK